MNKKYIFKNLRISLLKDNILRFEYVPNGKFSNEPTLFIDKKKEENFSFDIHQEARTWFKYLDLVIVFDEYNPLATLEIYRNDIRLYKYQTKRNSGELPLPNKTSYLFPVMDYPRLILGEDGYDIDSNYIYDKDVRDLFILISEGDYKKLRKQYISLTGFNNLARLKNLGLFNSRYYAYNDKSAREMIKKYKSFHIPLDNFVLDTDWREISKNHGVGYQVNEKLFPDISDFYHFAHENNVEVMMNDHPAPLLKKYNVLSKEEIAYRKENLTKFFTLGLDSWWYDRNWIVSLKSISRRIPVESLGRYLYHDVTRQFYQGLVLDPEVYIRPVAMSNITEIRNGQYDEIKDSKSHTYPFQWSGDIASDLGSLSNEVNNLNKCSNNMLGYYSSDIGGHLSNPNRNEFIRWYQYGAFSPIFRPHCTNSVTRFREPWVFGEKTLSIVKEYIYMRYRLLDVIYTEAFKHYSEGLGIFRPLYMNYPSDKKVYKEKSSYMLGENILISPIGGETRKIVPEKNYYGSIFASFYDNKNLKGKPILKKRLHKVDFELMNEKLYEEVPMYNFSAKYTFRLKFNKDVDLFVGSDDGVRVEVDGKRALNDWGDHAFSINHVSHLKAGVVHKIKLEYYQAGGGAELKLFYSTNNSNKKLKLYLPSGEWYNLSHRNVYQGKRYIKEKFAVEEMPLFVRAGTLLPLYKTVDNISKMSLRNIVYDYYPSRDRKVSDFFYEDDGVSTGYKVGIYRISRYKTEFKEDHYEITLLKSENNLDDRLDARNVMFKMHVRDKEKISKVLVNDEEVRIKNHDHNKVVYPFSSGEWSRDSKTTVFKFRQDLRKNYIIKIYVK